MLRHGIAGRVPPPPPLSLSSFTLRVDRCDSQVDAREDPPESYARRLQAWSCVCFFLARLFAQRWFSRLAPLIASRHRWRLSAFKVALATCNLPRTAQLDSRHCNFQLATCNSGHCSTCNLQLATVHFFSRNGSARVRILPHAGVVPHPLSPLRRLAFGIHLGGVHHRSVSPSFQVHALAASRCTPLPALPECSNDATLEKGSPATIRRSLHARCSVQQPFF